MMTKRVPTLLLAGRFIQLLFFAVSACISITLNVWFGLRLYCKNIQECKPTNTSERTTNISHTTESYMELGPVEEQNRVYIGLKSNAGQNEDTGTDYEVTLPKYNQGSALNGENIEKDAEKPYINVK